MENITLEDIHKLLLQLDKKIDDLTDKVGNNSLNVDKKKNKNVIKESDDYYCQLEEKQIKKLLEGKSPSAEFKFFKILYPKDHSNLPLKVIGKKAFCYFDGNKWIDDTDGSTMIKIFLENVRKAYMKVNIFTKYQKTPQKFIDNQQHIFNLVDESKIKKLITLIYKEYK